MWVSLNPIRHLLLFHFTKLRLTDCHSCPTHPQIYTDTYAHTWMHVHMHTEVCSHAWMHICTHTHASKYMYGQAHTHTHTNSCQQTETLGLKRKTGVQERENSQRPPQCLPPPPGSAFDFQLLIFTSSVTTSKQLYFRCPGPRLFLASLILNSSSYRAHVANGISLLIKFHVGSMGKPGRWQ